MKESENEIAIACARSEIEKELINHYEAIIKNANTGIITQITEITSCIAISTLTLFCKIILNN